MNNIQKAFKAKSKLRGMADGGKVKGKGGPTDDKVGPVMLSDGEYVLPADTVEIVGRDKLDALRLATHDFVDDNNKPKVSGLRKMANGGVFYVDPEGVASRRLPPGREVVPYQPPRAPIEGTATRVPPTATSSLRSAVNTGGGRVGGFVRGTLPVAAIGGVVDSFSDMNTGYRDRFNESVGATGPVSSVLGDTARVMSNVGDAITFGLAGRLGRGISAATSGGSFSEGFMSESDRDRFNRQQMERVMGQPATAGGAPGAAAQPSRPAGLPGVSNEANRRTGGGVDDVYPGAMENRSGLPNAALSGADPNSYYASLKDDAIVGTFNGRPITKGEADARAARLQTASFMPQKPAEDPIMGEIRSALRNLGGGGGGGGGGWTPPSREREINERFDKLASQLSSMYGPKGQGNLARRLLELEQARMQALDADARNRSALRGQDVQAATAANNASMQARMQALQTLGTMANQRSTQSAQALADLLKTLQEAIKARQEKEGKLPSVIDDAVEARSGGDKDRAATDRAKLVHLPPADQEVLQGLSPADQYSYLSTLLDIDSISREGERPEGRDVGAMATRGTALATALGGTAALAKRYGASGKMTGLGKTADKLLSKIPRVGRLSALRPFERLASLTGSPLKSAALGGAYGAYTTPVNVQTPDNVLSDFLYDADGNLRPDDRDLWTRVNQDGLYDGTVGYIFGPPQVYNTSNVLVDRPDSAEDLVVRKRLSRLRSE